MKTSCLSSLPMSLIDDAAGDDAEAKDVHVMKQLTNGRKNSILALAAFALLAFSIQANAQNPEQQNPAQRPQTQTNQGQIPDLQQQLQLTPDQIQKIRTINGVLRSDQQAANQRLQQ